MGSVRKIPTTQPKHTNWYDLDIFRAGTFFCCHILASFYELVFLLILYWLLYFFSQNWRLVPTVMLNDHVVLPLEGIKSVWHSPWVVSPIFSKVTDGLPDWWWQGKFFLRSKERLFIRLLWHHWRDSRICFKIHLCLFFRNVISLNIPGRRSAARYYFSW